jgi:hypothetical protein
MRKTIDLRKEKDKNKLKEILDAPAKTLFLAKSHPERIFNA